jgi:hypothetical protein
VRITVLLLLAGLVACGSAGDGAGQGSSTVTTVVRDDPPETTAELPVVAAAREDLAARLGVGLEAVTVVEARSVTWGDRSYGCPEPGMRYLPGVIEGMLVVLESSGRQYEYHGAEGTAPFLCEPGKGPAG